MKNLLFLLAFSANAFAQSETKKEMDFLLNEANKNGVFNGNVLVAQNDKIIYNASFGFADAGKTIKLTDKYRFSIGSITKEFSAVAIMQLVEQGKLKLSDSISQFFPELPKWAEKIKIEHLLQYSSGLPDIHWQTIKSDKDVFEDLKKIDSLNFEAGTNYNYNNNNVLLRQFIVEKISGMIFNSFSEKYLFQPCKMNDSEMNPSKNAKNIAKSFNDDFIEDPTDIPISGVAFVTTNDLFKWTQCLHGEKVINKNSLFEISKSFKVGSQAGLGRAFFEEKALKIHQHDGQSRNFEALLDSDLQENITIILLDNNKNEKLFEIANAIKTILKGEKYKIPKKSFAKYLRKQLDSLKIEDFILLYQKLKSTKNQTLNFESEDDLNSIGYEILSKNRIDDAIKIFRLNVEQFPTSANVYDSLAEAYYNKGDTKLAILNYKKSLELDKKNDNARQMIEKLSKNE